MGRQAMFTVLVVIAVLGLCFAPGSGQQPPDRNERVLRLFSDEFLSLTPGSGKFPAEFVIGSQGDAPANEKPATTINLKHPFALARYEVTQELYEAIMGKNPSRWKGPRNSVEMVSWDEAQDFCKKVTNEMRRLKLLSGDEAIRLPGEAEWEYACRAGTTTRYSFGDSAEALGEHAWFNGNAKGNDPPVGKKKPNAWGFHDMHGYVWEWCDDTWHEDHKLKPTNGTAFVERNRKERVIRGGAWTDDADAARSAFRRGLAAETRSDGVGFRCVKAKLDRKEAP